MKIFRVRWLIVILAISSFFCAFFWSWMWIICLVINAIILITVGINRLFIKTIEVKNSTSKRHSSYQPFVSVHLPICNEPPEIVCNTIQSILNQDYKNFELIVLSNNTMSEDLWRPVERLCEKNSSIVKFYNIENLKGYKAGALNECLKKSNCQTQYIFTVDSDYELVSNALTTALKLISDKNVDILQFPQSYRNVGSSNKALSNEFDRYFRIFAKSSSSVDCTLPTGTLTLIKTESLNKCGGWQEESITEDALLGTEFLKNKFSCRFQPMVLGKGLMPDSVIDLRKQRSRWIFGNVQVLRRILFSNRLDTFQKWFAALQLSAWFNFLGLPLLTLILFSLKSSVQTLSSSDKLALTISILSIFSHFILQYGLMYRKSIRFKELLSELYVDIANTDLSAFKWWEYLIYSKLPFKRTNKFKIKRDIPIKYYLIPLLILLPLVFKPNVNLMDWIIILIGLVILLSKVLLQIDLYTSKIEMNTKTDHFDWSTKS